jgi:DNA-directed RNA polymerase specialized sigma24 family protein
MWIRDSFGREKFFLRGRVMSEMGRKSNTTNALESLRNATKLLSSTLATRDDAASWIYKRFYLELKELAEKRFPSKIQSRVRESDVINEVMHEGMEWLCRQRDEPIHTYDFRAVLFVILDRKIVDHLRRNTTSKNGVQLEVPINARNDGDSDFQIKEQSANDPKIAVLIDDHAAETASIIFDEDDEVRRMINVLGLFGFKTSTIAAMLPELPQFQVDDAAKPPSERTINRLLAKTRTRIIEHFHNQSTGDHGTT